MESKGCTLMYNFHQVQFLKNKNFRTFRWMTAKPILLKWRENWEINIKQEGVLNYKSQGASIFDPEEYSSYCNSPFKSR